MMGKVAVTGVSLILVVGVIVGVVSTVSHRNTSSGGASANAASKLGVGMKAVDTLCNPVDYKDSCKSTLGAIVNKNETITLHDLLKAVFQVVQEQIQLASNHSDSIFSPKDPRQKMAQEDCKDLFWFAVDELQASLNLVGDITQSA